MSLGFIIVMVKILTIQRAAVFNGFLIAIQGLYCIYYIIRYELMEVLWIIESIYLY